MFVKAFIVNIINCPKPFFLEQYQYCKYITLQSFLFICSSGRINNNYNDDILIFTGECSVYPNRTACLSAFPGRECVWHNNGCLSLDVANFKQGIGIVNEFERSHNCTPDKGRLFLLTLCLVVASNEVC